MRDKKKIHQQKRNGWLIVSFTYIINNTNLGYVW